MKAIMLSLFLLAMNSVLITLHAYSIGIIMNQEKSCTCSKNIPAWKQSAECQDTLTVKEYRHSILLNLKL